MADRELFQKGSANANFKSRFILYIIIVIMIKIYVLVRLEYAYHIRP